MQFLMNILYILLYIVCLSILIVVHELGHLSMAKAFGVYCNEFSIGFGPKFFSHKRKNGETYVSLRCIPFGGYVSMYGEGMELPDGVEIPKERSINGIKKWKRAIILAAGVIMNALLALVIFFTYEVAFPKPSVSASEAVVAQTVLAIDENGQVVDTGVETLAYAAGIRTEDNILLAQTNLDYVYGVDPYGVVNYKDGTTKNVYVVLDGSSLLGYNYLSWGHYIHFCIPEGDDFEISFSEEREIIAANDIKDITFHIYERVAEGEEGDKWKIVLEPTIDKDSYYKFPDMGISFTYSEKYNDSFGTTVKNTFVDFGESSIAIVKGFGAMFTTREGFESAGGIIAIGVETTKVLTNFGFPEFLRIWGLISVNLAIVNLFPFPGLDGWQLLVLIVEGVAHKEIPQKVKSILSLIGIGLLFVLMILLLFKDFFTFIV